MNPCCYHVTLEIVKLLKGGTLHPVSPFHTLLLIIFILRAVETLTATITAFLHTVLAPSGFMVKNGPPPVLAAEEFLLLRSVLRAPVTASNNVRYLFVVLENSSVASGVSRAIQESYFLIVTICFGFLSAASILTVSKRSRASNASMPFDLSSHFWHMLFVL